MFIDSLFPKSVCGLNHLFFIAEVLVSITNLVGADITFCTALQ